MGCDFVSGMLRHLLLGLKIVSGIIVDSDLIYSLITIATPGKETGAVTRQFNKWTRDKIKTLSFLLLVI